MSQNGSGKKFDREEYRRRKAQRDQAREAQWIVNPETENEFYVRQVGMVGYALSGLLPHELTETAVAAWKQVGVGNTEGEAIPQVSPKAAKRTLDLINRVVADACVSPRIFPGADSEDALDPIEVDDSDLLYIFRYATRQIAGSLVPLKGGEEVAVADLQEFPEQSSELPGVGVGEPELQPAAV